MGTGNDGEGCFWGYTKITPVDNGRTTGHSTKSLSSNKWLYRCTRQ